MILSLLLVSFINVSANIYYISKSGNDATGNGSEEKPWATLGHAVFQIPPGFNHTIRISAGVYVEAGPVNVPAGINIEGEGMDQTVLKAAPSFYYNPAYPEASFDKFLIRLSAFDPAPGNQSLKNFSIDGDLKKLHGGIYVRYRDDVVIENIKVENTNFCGVWLLDLKNVKIQNVHLFNCSWGSEDYSSGALNIGNLDGADVDQLHVNEDTGYGIKAFGPEGYNDIFRLKIHNSHISVNPTGLWSNGLAPNIAIELWQINLVQCEIYNSYVDNTISLVNNNAIPSSGIQTIRVHHNILDMLTRANGAGYGIELSVHDAEVDHNYFIGGTYGIAHWTNPMQNWLIHHNVFYGQQHQLPGDILRSQWSGLHNVKFYNNTIELTGNRSMNIIGLYGGISENVDVRNNLIINSTTGYSVYPHEFIHTQNGATTTSLTVLKNATNELALGSLLRSLLNTARDFLSGHGIENLIPVSPESITGTGKRPAPYYFPVSGSLLINGGSPVNLPYRGQAPDIGAFEYGDVPSQNAPPYISITSPANNTHFPGGVSVPIQVVAFDRDGSISKVEFYTGETKLGESLAFPYLFTWGQIPDGIHSLTVQATDSDEGTATSEPVIIAMGPHTIPTVKITEPENRAVFHVGTTLIIKATVTDENGNFEQVEFFSGNDKLGESLSEPHQYVWRNVPVGNHTLRAKAIHKQTQVPVWSLTVEIIVASSKKNEINIYPNPATDQFTVQFVSDVPQTGELSILDRSARLVIEYNVTLMIGLNSLQVEVKHLSEGMYVVVLGTSTGQRTSALVMIHR